MILILGAGESSNTPYLLKWDKTSPEAGISGGNSRLPFICVNNSNKRRITSSSQSLYPAWLKVTVINHSHEHKLVQVYLS